MIVETAALLNSIRRASSAREIPPGVKRIISKMTPFVQIFELIECIVGVAEIKIITNI